MKLLALYLPLSQCTPEWLKGYGFILFLRNFQINFNGHFLGIVAESNQVLEPWDSFQQIIAENDQLSSEIAMVEWGGWEWTPLCVKGLRENLKELSNNLLGSQGGNSQIYNLHQESLKYLLFLVCLSTMKSKFHIHIKSKDITERSFHT